MQFTKRHNSAGRFIGYEENKPQSFDEARSQSGVCRARNVGGATGFRTQELAQAAADSFLDTMKCHGYPVNGKIWVEKSTHPGSNSFVVRWGVDWINFSEDSPCVEGV